MPRAGSLVNRAFWLALLVVVAGSFAANRIAIASPPWATLVPFKKTDADPKKVYELDESRGPWMVMAASFAGPTAEQQAQELVMELRQRWKMEAYTYRRTYDFSKPTEGLGYNRYGGPRRMRYANNYKFDEIAVLVGDFTSLEDPQLDKTLEKIKYARPDCLDATKKRDSSQRFLGLRTIYHMVSTNPDKKNKGPMGAAFVTRNPFLPEEGSRSVRRGYESGPALQPAQMPGQIYRARRLLPRRRFDEAGGVRKARHEAPPPSQNRRGRAQSVEALRRSSREGHRSLRVSRSHGEHRHRRFLSRSRPAATRRQD
jgi:hypothetical protein